MAARQMRRWRHPVLVFIAILATVYYFSNFQISCDSGTQYTSVRSRGLLSNEKGVNTTTEPPPPPPQFPDDLFSEGQRKHGAVVLHVLGLVYMFVALAIVCDEFFVPSLDVITEKLGITEDVAGATFMAAGGSAPELFTSVIGVFISYDDVGIGTIVGSAVFNILFVISMCAVFSKSVLTLTWWPLFRDVTFYSASLIALILCFTDNIIHWYEAVVLLACYALYVTFMKFNSVLERAVKKCLNRKKTTKVGSTDHLVHLPTIRGRISTPTLHAGTKFRQGLLQLMIHSIDPMNEGKLDEKTIQLQTVANIRVLLDHPSAGSQKVAQPEVPAAPPSAEKSVQTDLSELSVHSLADGVQRIRLQPLSIKGEKLEGYVNPALENGTVNPVVGGSAVSQAKEAEQLAEAVDEPEQPLDISWPSTAKERVNYVLLAPIILPLWVTLPDVRRPEKRKWFPISFIGSILWIAVFSYLMVWWATLVGAVVGIPNEVMGLVFLAAGTSIPDLITSVLVARKGLGDMAVSSSIGSNLFDITVGLPLPWLLSALIFGPVKVNSTGMMCSVVLLFLMLIFVIVSIAVFRWKLNVGLAVVMFLLYFVFVACALLLEYDVVSCTGIINVLTGK